MHTLASQLATARPVPSRPKPATVAALLFVSAAVFLMVMVGGISLPWVAALGTVLLLVMLVHPDVATLAVIFALYANLAPAAVRFHGMPRSLAVVIFLVLFVPATYHVVIRRERLRMDSVLPLLLLYFVIQLASVLLSRYPLDSALPVQTVLLQGVALYILILNTVRTPEMLRRAIWAMLLGGALLGSLSVVQEVTKTYTRQYGGLALTRTTNAEGELREARVEGARSETGQGRRLRPRSMGSIGDANFYGQILVVLVPLAALRFRAETRVRMHFLAALCLSAVMGGIVLTFSRGAGLALAVIAVAFGLLRHVPLRYAVVAFALVSVVMLSNPNYRARMETLVGMRSDDLRAADSSAKQRASIMRASWQIFLDHPILGVGVGQAPRYIPTYTSLGGYHRANRAMGTHSMYLEILAETGLIGFGAFLAMLYTVVARLIRLQRYWFGVRREYAHTIGSLVLALLGFLICGIFLHLAYARYFWLLVALCGAAAHAYRPPELDQVIPGAGPWAGKSRALYHF